MDVREIADRAVDVHNDIQFADFMKLAGRYEPTSMPWYFRHITESIIGIGDTTGQTITGSGTPTVVAPLTVATSGQFRVGDVMKFPNNKNGRVQSISTNSGQDTLTIRSVDNTNLTLAAGNFLTKITGAGSERSDARVALRHKTSTQFNHIQYFHETYEHSDIGAMTDTELIPGPNGQNFIVYLGQLRAIEQLKLDIAGAVIGGQISAARYSDASPTLPGANGYAVQTTRGLDQYVDTLGFKRQLSTLGTHTLADIAALEDLAIAAKTTKSFMVIGATRCFRPLKTLLKNLGSSGVTSVRMRVDGREVDLNVEQYMSHGNFSYEFVNFTGFDNPNMFPASGGVISKSLYYIPKDSAQLAGGGTAPRFLMRYLDNRKLGATGANVKWADLIMERWSGGLAPQPTGQVNEAVCTFNTYQGLEILGAEHFGRETVLA